MQCRHDFRVAKGDVVEKRLELPGINHKVPVVAMRLPELSRPEQLFWDYLLANFSRKL